MYIFGCIQLRLRYPYAWADIFIFNFSTNTVKCYVRRYREARLEAEKNKIQTELARAKDMLAQHVSDLRPFVMLDRLIYGYSLLLVSILSTVNQNRL